MKNEWSRKMTMEEDQEDEGLVRRKKEKESCEEYELVKDEEQGQNVKKCGNGGNGDSQGGKIERQELIDQKMEKKMSK